jgi:hypothetical protein
MLSAASEDHFLAIDKLEHFLACALATLALYVVSNRVEKLHPYRIILSFCGGLLIGAAKEFGDWAGVSADPHGTHALR